MPIYRLLQNMPMGRKKSADWAFELTDSGMVAKKSLKLDKPEFVIPLSFQHWRSKASKADNGVHLNPLGCHR